MLKFQSTLPMRGATLPTDVHAGKLIISIHAPHAGSDVYFLAYQKMILIYFNPRSPCGERLKAADVEIENKISIHAPHAGSDLALTPICWIYLYFNPRSPCGERPIHCGADYPAFISIHAPHAGSDLWGIIITSRCLRFQSTLPMRGATVRHGITLEELAFQSTLPMRGAT